MLCKKNENGKSPKWKEQKKPPRPPGKSAKTTAPISFGGEVPYSRKNFRMKGTQKKNNSGQATRVGQGKHEVGCLEKIASAK